MEPTLLDVGESILHCLPVYFDTFRMVINMCAVTSASRQKWRQIVLSFYTHCSVHSTFHITLIQGIAQLAQFLKQHQSALNLTLPECLILNGRYDEGGPMCRECARGNLWKAVLMSGRAKTYLRFLNDPAYQQMLSGYQLEYPLQNRWFFYNTKSSRTELAPAIAKHFKALYERQKSLGFEWTLFNICGELLTFAIKTYPNDYIILGKIISIVRHIGFKEVMEQEGQHLSWNLNAFKEWKDQDRLSKTIVTSFTFDNKKRPISKVF